MSGLSREMIIHPGETLKEVLEDRGMSQSELAIRTGFTAKHISTVLNGEKNISVSFAKKLEYALNIETEFWMNLQWAYDKELIEFDELNSISAQEFSIVKRLKAVVDFLQDKGIITACNRKEQKVLELRKFLNISNLSSIPGLVSSGAFRVQTNISLDEYVLYSWQRICEVLSESIEVEKIDGDEQKEKIISIIPQIKKMMFKNQNEFIPELKKMFSENGIAFCIAPSFKGAPVQGFIKTTNRGKTILCMTFQQKKADVFWFTLLHELGHFINGDAKQKFVDFESVENIQEIKADVFAQDSVIDKDEYDEFVNEDDFSIAKIKSFAKKQGVPVFMVIGRLQSEEYLKWSDFSDEKITYFNEL